MEASFIIESAEVDVDFCLDKCTKSPDHNLLKNRDLNEQHPISAITDLQEQLDDINERIKALQEAVSELVKKLEA